jgi:predicted short-subunit dehydrogenase-like oxidoreductase (DUF2520 family)
MSKTDLPSIVVIGPGCAGQSLAKRWVDAGVVLHGFLGRTIQGGAAAARFVGTGRVLDISDIDAKFLETIDAVLLSVQDDQLVETVAQLADRVESAGANRSILFFHCSGSNDLSVLGPLREAGAHTASLHPLCPMPAPDIGYRNLPGKPAVIEVHHGDVGSLKVLEALARAAKLEPVATTGGDRLLYHAACVLAANGLTALYSLVKDLFERAMPDGSVESLPPALMQAAIEACRDEGPVLALSGPVLRGDAKLVGRQLEALRELEPPAVGEWGSSVFQTLMRGAAAMAAERQELRGKDLEDMQKVLDA